MNTYTITKEDVQKRIYFITKLVQNQTGSTMQGALTSKSDSMGGIFDRFINTLSDTLIFDKIIFQKPAFKSLGKEIKTIEDFYYYKPIKSVAGIAPDIFGIVVDGKTYPFTKFDNKWKPVENMPQIEVKTFKAKDQMISLRNQDYDNKYLVLVDLDMRIDYLVPFLDKTVLNSSLISSMKMDDSVFIVRDDNNLITRLSEIDFSNSEIGKLMLISITNASDFMRQSTLCNGKESISRMKEIKERKTNIVNGLLHIPLSNYASHSPRISCLYEFNSNWFSKMNIPNSTKCLDFSANNIEHIEINKFNNKGIVISAKEENCTFNGTKLIIGKQYSINFEVLDRSGNEGSEYFMQKECACHLIGLEKELTDEIINIIK